MIDAVSSPGSTATGLKGAAVIVKSWAEADGRTMRNAAMRQKNGRLAVVLALTLMGLSLVLKVALKRNINLDCTRVNTPVMRDGDLNMSPVQVASIHRTTQRVPSPAPKIQGRPMGMITPLRNLKYYHPG